jgi:Ca-activated chloride channel family protein
MSFVWPEFLWSLAALPLLVLLYWWLLHRRKKVTLKFANLALVKQVAGKGPGWRRHVPPVLMLLALATLFVAASRPRAVVTLPLQQETIILAMDVSGSMRATDVQPNRLVAAQDAVVQPPTLNREDIEAAIDRFQLQRGTAIGSGIVLSLATIFPEAGIDLSQITGARNMPVGPGDKPPKEFTPVAPGSFSSAAIVLLTDGQRTTGPDPMDAAKMAADRGVKVYSVGIGTKEGETIGFEGWSMRVRLDEETLKGVSNLTRAEYFYAGTADDLKKVYQSLSSRLVVEKKETEITAFFAAAAALMVLVSAALSVWWFGRVA